MLTYSVTEAKAKFYEVFAKAAAGEKVVLTKQGKPLVFMGEYKARPKHGLLGCMKGKPFRIADDFDELPDEIARAFGMID